MLHLTYYYNLNKYYCYDNKLVILVFFKTIFIYIILFFIVPTLSYPKVPQNLKYKTRFYNILYNHISYNTISI